MGFFNGIEPSVVKEITGVQGTVFNQTLAALRLSKIANGVSKKHGEVARQMWAEEENICQIISITNAQNQKYWSDKRLYKYLERGDIEAIQTRKKTLKRKFFEVVADQTGKIMDPDVLTIIWARRFAEYKRPDLITSDFDRFKRLVTDKKRPIQIIWAGKPYPTDYGAISTFDNLVYMNKEFMNCAILVGYELWLSLMCKRGADIWLNNPRISREASGTSGMTAAMNGAVNFSTQDGWFLEFARHRENCFVVPLVDHTLPHHQQDQQDAESLLNVLEEDILPMYYEHPEQWNSIVANSLQEVVPYFDSDRMADEYYQKLYEFQNQAKHLSLVE
jgi:starch phosphorylase